MTLEWAIMTIACFIVGFALGIVLFVITEKVRWARMRKAAWGKEVTHQLRDLADISGEDRRLR